MTEQEALQLGELDGHDQGALVARGELSSRELAEAALIRIDRVDAEVNSVTYAVAPDRIADPAGASALAGAPWLLKASLEHPGWPMTSCSRARASARGRSAYPFAQALERAGLVPVGMTAMPEFGLLTSGEPLLTGAVHNPWSLDRSAGGSSTGAAAAVAAGLTPLAHASDAAGSIRVPAACCGVVGLKVSRGANLRARAPNLIDDLLCCDGLIGRSVRDVAWGFEMVREPSAVVEPARPLRGLRVALCLAGLEGQIPTLEVAAAVEEAAVVCAGLGLEVSALAALPVDGPAIAAAFRTFWAHEGGDIVELVAASNPGVPLDRLLEPWTLSLGIRRQAVTAAETAAAFSQVAVSAARLEAVFGCYDILLSPVAASSPPRIGELAPTREFQALWNAFWQYTGYTPLANIAGAPSISLPLGRAGSVPIGVMATAATGADRTLLALGAALEEAAPWRDRWPAHSAHALLRG